MSLTLIALGATVAVLLALLVWTLRGSERYIGSRTVSKALQGSGRTHVSFLPQMRQGLRSGDAGCLMRAGFSRLRNPVRRERRRVALLYLSALRQDFEELMRISRIIAGLSPEIGVGQELERLRLRTSFLWRYRIVWMSLWAGLTPLPQISNLSNLLSGYSVRLEEAMKELGERAAIVAEMVSSPDRRSIHPV